MTILHLKGLHITPENDPNITVEDPDFFEGPDYMEFDPIPIPQSATMSQLQNFLTQGNIHKNIDEVLDMDKNDYYRFWKSSGYSKVQQKLIKDVVSRGKTRL